MPKVLYPTQEQRYAKTYLNIKKNNKAKRVNKARVNVFWGS